MKVIAILDEKKRLIRSIPNKLALIDVKTHAVIGDCQTGLEMREGEVTKKMDLPDDWRELHKSDFSRKVGEKLFGD